MVASWSLAESYMKLSIHSCVVAISPESPAENAEAGVHNRTIIHSNPSHFSHTAMHQSLATWYHGSPTGRGQDSAEDGIDAILCIVWSVLRSASR
ncbi:uncharacterized [Tachysurus ichikawai]